MAFAEPLLTKSKYMNGLQCRKLLWYACNESGAFPKVDLSTQALFEQGHEVNALAQTLFPGGVLIDWSAGFGAALDKTRAALQGTAPVFEAGLKHAGLFARIDILRRADGGMWDLIEVKSSTQVKEEHLADVAFQRHVCEEAGIKIGKCFLMHVDNTYVRRGAIEPSKLLASVDITGEVASALKGVWKRLPEMRSIIAKSQHPETPVGEHCDRPYPCALKKMCWSAMPERHVFALKGGGRLSEELLKRGIVALKDIPAGIELNRVQAIQVECEKSAAVHVEPDQLRNFLDALVYPVYLLDFETISPAIPSFDLSSPYEQIPFQYSLHVIPRPDATPSWSGYLHDSRQDPRPPILRRLRAELGTAGSILAYNAKFEIGVLDNAAEAYPEYREWFQNLEPRFVDLYQPFKAFHYYHPAQNGRASLKVVMPALTGRGYADLQIGVGDLASREFFRITFSDVPESERRKIRAALEAYCLQDTEGMIDMIHALDKLSRAAVT